MKLRQHITVIKVKETVLYDKLHLRPLDVTGRPLMGSLKTKTLQFIVSMIDSSRKIYITII